MSGQFEQYAFPPLETATPEGLLAVGGDLSSGRLLAAYRQGIFPWYSTGQPILWWSPDPRTVLYPEQLRVKRSLRSSLRKQGFRITTDRAFGAVIQSCAAPRSGESEGGTWITAHMMDAYTQLNRDGYAHSLEVWQDECLVGGLYGIAIGRVFFGESMFSRARDASKVGLVGLVRILTDKKFEVIDCQLPSDHLFSLGAQSIPRTDFIAHLRLALDAVDTPGLWDIEFEGLQLS